MQGAEVTLTKSNAVEATVQPLLVLAIAAGAKILEIYAQPFEAEEKSDGSPVTAADGWA